MVKTKTVWYCAECGSKQAKWSGQCSACLNWNTMKEEMEVQSTPRFAAQQEKVSRPVRLTEVELSKTPRISTTMSECDRLLGGGLVPGSLTLVGGDPGIGKSTLMLQMANALGKQGLLVFYISGEESVEQTTMRALRLGITTENLLLISETEFTKIYSHIEALNPDILIVDSIQIIYKSSLPSSPGSVAQVREATGEFMHLAKGRQMATFLIGHVTKSGEIAGPKMLEHMVDSVLYFEGDKQNLYRIIRVVKNRFGPTDEIALFQMKENGLAEVPNPSEVFLQERRKGGVGSIITTTLEGSRPILIEMQALVTESSLHNPSRKSTGLDSNRLALLLAVLEKRVGYQTHVCDVFVSVVGGLRILEPAIDLAILLAVASSYRNVVLDPDAIAIGEVGLGGEVRSVSRMDARIKEAYHMGFKKCLIPKGNVAGLESKEKYPIQIVGIDRVEEAIRELIG